MQRYTNCYDPDFGSENEDGYVRMLNKPRPEGGRLVMRHRLIWEWYNGPIPEGFEINHLCKNRRCCNPEHLECLTKSEHKSKDNALRYKKREVEVLAFISENPSISQKKIGERFGLAQATISKMIKRNK